MDDPQRAMDRPQATLDRERATPPSVDVIMLAHNVGPFIESAVNGVLSQVTDFPVRLLIGEDGSIDDTRAVCERLAYEHSGAILYLPGERNLGIAKRAVDMIGRCTAKYVAICDSDDRWDDPTKLARQVSFLEAHPDHGISCTDVWIITRQGEMLLTDGYDGVRMNYASGDVFMKLLRGNFINNSTTVVRRDLLQALRPNACRDDIIGDYIRWLQLSMRTKVHFLPDRTTLYRQGGISSGDRHARNRLVMRRVLGELLLEHHSTRPRLNMWERKTLLRKTLGVLARPGTNIRVKAALLIPLFRYLPAIITARPHHGSGHMNNPAA